MQHPNKLLPKPKAPPRKAAKADGHGRFVPQAGPDHVRVMAVFVTNQCNLACINCCSDTVKKATTAGHLSWRDFKNAIDIFMDPKQTPYEGKKVICVEGGETFLVYPLLQKAVEYCQSFEPPPHIYIHTNGTLVKPEQIKALRKYGVEILFSLDGDKTGNDHFRRYPEPSKKSVWESTMERIKDLPKEGLGINMVIRPIALPGLTGALSTLADAGFKFINLAIDYYHMWTPEELKALEKFMDEFFDYYAGYTEKHGTIPFLSGAIHDGLKRAGILKLGKPWWGECAHVILGSDGHFYSCESIGMFPWSEVAEKYSINHASAGKGIDWKKRNAYMKTADEALGDSGKPDSEWQHMCPRLYYTVANVRGESPKDLVDNMHRTSRILYQGLLKLSARLRGNKSFQEGHVFSDVVQGT